ncbi:MBL fold metallo-hydrolase [Lewinella sp. IMCC34183]|uniref:MBL fold metallo-hydrolase n=1 Tax=Lewinella sp. IMCC34183 TaxID=2248762 RepID=UPI000E27FE62|nr:MBL fold metallo-hydrolase [Lewinella sp. IMCC34183]
MTTVVSLTQNPVQENTYLVFDNDTKEAIIFDPGAFSNQEERELADKIEQLGLKPVKLINTHCHFDHVFGNAFVKNTYGLELGIHPLEQQILESAPRFVEMYGMPPMTPSPAPDYFINEGDTVTLGDTTFEVLFCPGHSPGSICFYNRAENYVIAGDVLFRRSIGRTDLPLGDHNALIGSILTKLMPLPDDTVVYPGHGPSTTIGEERRENPFL